MKKLTGLIIILAALTLGGYYGMGVMTEKAIKKNIAVIDQSNGLTAEIEQYHRGYFCSNAQIKWKLHIPEHIVKDDNGQTQVIAAQDYQLDMPVKIHHGPVIWANHKLLFGMGYAESKIPFPEEYKAQFENSFTPASTKPELDLSIFVNYLAKSTVDLKIPAFKLISKDNNGEVNWQGLESTTSVTSQVDKIAGGFTIDGFEVDKEGSKMTVSKVSSTYDLHETPAGIYLGVASFSLPTFVIENNNQKMLQLQDLNLTSDSNIEDNLFSTSFNVSFKSLFANGQNYGPGILEMALKNLDAEVLAKINEQANSMQNGTDFERQRAMLEMLPQLPKLLNKGAEFVVSKLNVTLPEGVVNGTMQVTLPKGDINPFEIFQKITGNAKLTLPKAVVQKAMQQSLLAQMAKQPDLQEALTQQLQNAQQTPSAPANAAASAPVPATKISPEQLAAIQANKELSAMEQAGYLVVNGPEYTIEVNLDQGKFTVNGKPFDPANIKF